MEFSDVFRVRAPTRFSIAGGFALAVVLASMMHAPADVFAPTGPLGLFGIDKWVHFGSYAGVSLLLSYAYLARTARVLVTILVVTFVIGTGVELIQSTISWRTMEAADVVANTFGSVVALGCWWLAWRWLPISTGHVADR